MTVLTRATFQDLYHVPGNRKAELVGGEIVMMSPTGAAPNFAAGEIFASLREYARRTGQGRAVTDNAAFRVDLAHRQSLSPDAAFHTGPVRGMKFFDRAPTFAAEVRSENDYGPAAEEKIRAKIRDYFDAGTRVVWDVDLLGEEVVKVYRDGDLERPAVYRLGEVAEAEPAVPGWSMAVDELMD